MSSRTRVCMFVMNGFQHDTRVLKQAATLNAAGYKIRIIASLEPGTQPTENVHGLRVFRARRHIPLLAFVLRLLGATPPYSAGTGVETQDMPRTRLQRFETAAVPERGPGAALRRFALRVYRRLSHVRFRWSALLLARNEAADVWIAHDLDTLAVRAPGRPAGIPQVRDEPGWMSDPPGRAIRCAQRAVLRTGSGPLRVLWLGAYRMIIAITAAMLRYRSSGASVYARGSFGAAAHPVPGLSDIDLILVVPDSLDEPPGAVRRRILEPWLRVTSHLPWLGDLVTVGAFEDRELEDAMRATLLTHGLDQAGGARALFAGRDPLRDHLTARAKPGIPAPMADWRRVAGPERRPACRPRPDDAWAAAWLDLQCWWRYAFRAAARPDEPHVPYLGVKLVAEPVRTLLWLRHGVSILSRRRALKQGLHFIAEEEDAIRSAIHTLDHLHLGPESQLPERIAALLRLSCLVAREIAAAARQCASTAVSLLTDAGEATEPSGARRAQTALLDRFPGITARMAPVCDWRALCVPGDPEETMVLVSGACASDPTVLASLGSVERPGVVPALSAADVIVEPTLDYRPRPILRGVLRAVQCRQSDPVTFSLLAGEPVAMFPGIPGWSAWDTARRAVAEYGARLAEADDDCNLNTLLAAARASLYLETLSHGEPRLAVDGAAVCSELVRQRHTTATMGMAACEAWRAQRTLGAAPEAGLIRELSVAVRKLSFNAASPDVQRCTLTTG